MLWLEKNACFFYEIAHYIVSENYTQAKMVFGLRYEFL